MKIALISIGTRGDVEPFIAIALKLRKEGHDVVCALPEQFRHLAQDADLPFFSLGSKFIALINSKDAQDAMGGNPWRKTIGTIKTAINQVPANKELVQRQKEIIASFTPERVLHSAKALYPIVWSLLTRGRTILVTPIPFMHYVKGHAHVAFGKSYSEWINKLTYRVANWGMGLMTKKTLKWAGEEGRISISQVKTYLETVPTAYTISPALFPRPDYWPLQRKVVGYQLRNYSVKWRAEPELENFLQQHEKIVFITFGSMTNAQPLQKSKAILKMLEKHEIAAIVNTAGGGLVRPEGYESPHIYFVEQIPYDYIFPQVYAVVHHGGAGTTHLAVRYACASMIVPHIIDQFIWRGIIHQRGLGPKGPKVSQLNAKNFEAALLDLISNNKYKEKAQRLSEAMAEEDFDGELMGLLCE